jgi:hypothetical protein
MSIVVSQAVNLTAAEDARRSSEVETVYDLVVYGYPSGLTDRETVLPCRFLHHRLKRTVVG